MHNYHVFLVLVFTYSQDEYAATPLLMACGGNHINVARFLIQEGANIDIQNKVISFVTSSVALSRAYRPQSKLQRGREYITAIQANLTAVCN